MVDTQEGAVLAALTAPLVASMNAATDETEWFVLEMTFMAEKVMERFMSRILHRQPSGGECGRLRWFGVIELSDAAAVQWTEFRLAATGTDAWADRVLDATMRYQLFGSCFGCGIVGGRKWIAKKEFEHKAFCGNCWHTWHMETAFPSLFEQAAVVARDGLPESCSKRRKGDCGIVATRS